MSGSSGCEDHLQRHLTVTDDRGARPIYPRRTHQLALPRRRPDSDITEGVGLVGTRDGNVIRVRAGDTVICPPDEEHWHGGAANTFMSHLAMLEAKPDGSDPNTWLEPLTDEDYQKRQIRLNEPRVW
jgi:hypothetical protein